MPENLVQADCKLMVRCDRPAGVIRAWIADRRDDSQRIELGTLSIGHADEFPGVYQAWVTGMTEVMNLMVEAIVGVPVVRNDVLPRPRPA